MVSEAAISVPSHIHDLGAKYLGASLVSFSVWAPRATAVSVHLTHPRDQVHDLEPSGHGYFYGEVEGVTPGTRYKYRLNGSEFPDPASRSQPDGVHEPSEVIDLRFPWTDSEWKGLSIEDYAIYELHIGTFTPEGTFDAAVEHLDYLKQLGVTAIEVMPIAQFPGHRNWGYDGVYPFAVQSTYGGPAAFQRFVNAAHSKGLAVILDVVYNHLGPEGNYLSQFGPYFTDRYKTPWGQAINFDGDDSAEVRSFFVQNAVQWMTEFHVDALRLDAIHGIFDNSEIHILRELGEVVKASAQGRLVHLIAESDLNETRVIRPASEGGYGMDAQWNDDFHHSLHSLLTSENKGYYADFGSLDHLATAYRNGYVYSGQFSRFRNREHGTPSAALPANRFVVFTENHDQIGNRMFGERLTDLLQLEAIKLSAGALILSPYIPLLFMGQEYADTSPFQYFVSHSDESLIQAIRDGRRKEFESFEWAGDVPDPQAVETFLRSKLKHELRDHPKHKPLLEFYRELFRLRRVLPSLRNLSKEHCEVIKVDAANTLVLRRWLQPEESLTLLHFSDKPVRFDWPLPEGLWRKVIDSADARWNGPGGVVGDEIATAGGNYTFTLPPKSVCLLVRGNG